MDELKLLVCSLLEPEFRTLLAEEEFHNLTLEVFPQCCGLPTGHGRGEYDPPGEASGARTLVLEGFCGPCSSGNGKKPALFGCLGLLAGEELVASCVGRGCHLLTPGWLAQWPRHLSEWGFDRPTARDFFGDSGTTFLLLDTGVSPKAGQQLRDFAEHTGRPWEVLTVGLSLLRQRLRLALLKRSMLTRVSALERSLKEARREIADYAVWFDQLGQLSGTQDEPAAIARIVELLNMLFMPRDVAFVSRTGSDQRSCSFRQGSATEGEVLACVDSLEKTWAPTPSGTGFVFALADGHDNTGYIFVDGVGFPDNLDRYVSFALNLRGLCQLVIEDIRAHAAVARMSVTDALTGLFNRRYLDTHAGPMLELSRRHGRPLSVMMVDLDHFKIVNDTRGHAAGDEVLRSAAALLMGGMRKTNLCARIGGEEFCVVLPETDVPGGVIAATRFVETLAKTPFGNDGDRFHVTASVGIAGISPVDRTLDELIGRADVALYQAKRAGRNRVVACS